MGVPCARRAGSGQRQVPGAVSIIHDHTLGPSVEDNRLAISRVELVAIVLEGLKHHLMEPDLFKEFCHSFIAEVNRARFGAGAERAATEAELTKIKRRLRQIVDAIAEGVPARTLKDELLTIEAREDVLKAKLEAVSEPKVLLSPGMAEIYRARVAGLHEALNAPDADRGAVEAIRSLIEKIVLVPVDGKLAVDICGDIGTILKLAKAKQARNVPGLVSEQLVVVAGACNRVCYSSWHRGSCRVPPRGQIEDRHQLAA